MAGVIRSLLVHGKGKDKYNNVRIGLNARLDTLQAAILIEKLKIFPEEIERRQLVANRYSEAIGASAGGLYEVSAPTVAAKYSSVWAQYTISTKRRDELRTRLATDGIPTMIYYEKPMHLLDAMAFLGYRKGDFPVAEQSSKVALSLPMHPYLTVEEQDRVITVLSE